MEFNCIIIYSSFVIFLQGGGTLHLDPPHSPTFAPSFPLPPPRSHCRQQPGRAKAGENGVFGLGCRHREVEGTRSQPGFPWDSGSDRGKVGNCQDLGFPSKSRAGI